MGMLDTSQPIYNWKPIIERFNQATARHDGILPGGDTYEVYCDGAGKDALICIHGTHNLSNYEVVLEPKQALSLLAWLKQEQAALEKLVSDNSGEK